MTGLSRETWADRPLGEIVGADYRTAAVFQRFGIDYCCRGRRTLEEAATDHGVPIDRVISAIAMLPPETPPAQEAWRNLDDLTRHIVSRHHNYVREIVPPIESWLAKLVAKHADRHPELREVQQTFARLRGELLAHMTKEEHVLFPYIDELAVAARSESHRVASPFGTITHPVRVMEHDHEVVGEMADRLHKLTDAYTPPSEGCVTYKSCYAELARFEADLHLHIHLENNVLFPRAVELENALT